MLRSRLELNRLHEIFLPPVPRSDSDLRDHVLQRYGEHEIEADDMVEKVRQYRHSTGQVVAYA